MSMRLLLDNDVIFTPRESLALALKTGVEEAERRGRIIIEVHGDGRPLGDDLLSAPPDDASGISELRLISADPNLLVAETLMQAADSLRLARQHQSSASDKFLAGDTDAALDEVKHAFGVWQAVRDAFEKSAQVLGTQLFEAKFDVGNGQTRAAREDVDALTAALREVRDAMEAQDWSALADAMEYGLSGVVDRWEVMLTAIARAIREGRVGGSRRA
ncbi:MAG: hypothetical protein JNL50_12970 [Phycisphaerae bacterium]|nr:hypothetical protein [Phycisphaerae bacterium]